MSNYHRGEIEVQELAGARRNAEFLTGMFYSAMPPSASEFVETKNFAALTWHDNQNRLWITPLSGPAGFLHVIDSKTISVDMSVGLAPVASLQEFKGDKVALILLDFDRRRRMRVNGIARSTNKQLLITVEQTYGNCPKYIQRREPKDLHYSERGDSPDYEDVHDLDEQMQALINKSDTFFIGTYASLDGAGGADASHRGGNPGFVKADKHTVHWTDFPGNNMFNTLGNIQVNRETALLFVDFATGDGLALSGNVETFTPSSGGKSAAKETVFRVQSAKFLPRGLAQTWELLEYSPFNDVMD